MLREKEERRSETALLAAVDEQNAQTKVREEEEEHVMLGDGNRGAEEAACCHRAAREEAEEQGSTAGLPVLTTSFHESPECWDPWGIAMGHSVGASLKDTLQVGGHCVEREVRVGPKGLS